MDRDFRADAPNEIWLTDITEFSIPAGKVYLSLIIDRFDGKAVASAMSTSPNAGLVNAMLDDAAATLKEGEHPSLTTTGLPLSLARMPLAELLVDGRSRHAHFSGDSRDGLALPAQ